jgi:nucleoside-diphosphate-sugar epimerase
LRYDARMPLQRPLVILGSGYTGRCLYRAAQQQGLPIQASSRRPDIHLTYVEPQARLRFDLADAASWSWLPPGADLIWTFPAAPLAHVQAFARHYCKPPQRLVVLGSTSAYDTQNRDAAAPARSIDETSPINTSLLRVQGEEYLRSEHGAIILRVAGIYGPQRSPLEWIRQGRVGPTAKIVNFIHVEDLARLCLLALQDGQAGEVYNVSDGQPRPWADICAEASRRWGIVSPRQEADTTSGKCILNKKLVEHFHYTFLHPDIYLALEAMQLPSPGGEEPPPQDILARGRA